jgi:hypothetical protein
MRMTRFQVGFAAAALLLASAGVARAADNIGTPGPMVGFEHNDDSSDEAGLADGSLFIDEGGGTTREYRWGGSLCPGRELDTAQQSMLLEAGRGKWVVLPYYKLGNGGARCLTSFGFAMKKKFAAGISK